MVQVGPKIALIHDFLTVFAGAERVLQALHEVFPEAPIYTMFYDPAMVEKHFSGATIFTSPLQRSWLKRKPALLLNRMPRAVESYDLSGYDLVISSSGAFSHGVITGPETVHISYCHSPMRYAWDWHAEYLEEKGIRSPLARFLANQSLSKLRLWDSLSAKRVDTWLANSENVAKRIKTFYRADSQVIYPPVDTDFFNPELITPVTVEPYLFSVCRLSKNKRVDQIIEAAAAVGLPVHIAGAGSELPRLQQLAANLEGQVTFLGAISEEEKRVELAQAAAFVFAAEDDFGIAPVEALAMGTPVIALGKGGALETVVDGKNGLLYPHPTAASLSAALETFLHSGISFSKAEIRKSSLAYSKERFKEQIRQLVPHA